MASCEGLIGVGENRAQQTYVDTGNGLLFTGGTVGLLGLYSLPEVEIYTRQHFQPVHHV